MDKSTWDGSTSALPQSNAWITEKIEAIPLLISQMKASGRFSKSHLELAVEDELGGVNNGACGSARCKAVYSSQKLLSSEALFFLKVSKNIQNIYSLARGEVVQLASQERPVLLSRIWPNLPFIMEMDQHF